jgi:hypothetical protein
VPHQVVQCGQRRRVVLQAGRSPERIPLWSLLLNLPNHRSRKPPTRGQLTPSVSRSRISRTLTGTSQRCAAREGRCRPGRTEPAHPPSRASPRGRHSPDRPAPPAARRSPAAHRSPPAGRSFAVHTTRLIGIHIPPPREQRPEESNLVPRCRRGRDRAWTIPEQPGLGRLRHAPAVASSEAAGATARSPTQTSQLRLKLGSRSGPRRHSFTAQAAP